MRLHRGALKLIKVSSFVPGVSSDQSVHWIQESLPLDGNSRWTLRVVGSFYSWKHKPLKFCILLGVATVSELGKGDMTREGEVARRVSSRVLQWVCSFANPLCPHVCRGARQALSPPSPLHHFSQGVLCRAWPARPGLDQHSGQWGHCAKTGHRGRVNPPLFKMFVLILGFLWIFSTAATPNLHRDTTKITTNCIRAEKNRRKHLKQFFCQRKCPYDAIIFI